MVVLCLSIVSIRVSAKGTVFINQQKNNLCPYPELNQIILLNEGETLIINDTENPMFWEFNDYKLSFKIMNEFNRELLYSLMLTDEIGELSENNWMKYKEKFLTIYPEDSYGQVDKNVKILQQFFIVCENHEINKVSKNIYRQRGFDLVELAKNLPYTSPILVELKNTKQLKINGDIRGYSEGISYAKKYAASPNMGSYNYYSGADCANFASQILKAAGYTTDSRWKPYTSSWINAHSFTLYWYMKTGASNGYPGFASVSAAVNVGNVISVDYQKDGRYDHVGYVVATGSKTTSGYYDITIAQHSSNYCEKVSSSLNGWENTSGLYVRLPV